MGMALLLSIPLLSLILIRLLWSGSGLWYLLVGILFLGVAAALFLARRNDERGPTTLADEPNRLPLVLMGIGMVFVVLLLLPNFSGDSSASPLQQVRNQSRLPTQSAAIVAHPTVRTQPTRRATSQPTPQPTDSSQVQLQQAPDDTTSAPTAGNTDTSPPPGSETYVVKDGDTLWDIASSHDVTVESIIAANQLDSADDLQIGDEIAIPPATADATDSTPADGTGQ
jgi:LysM repeat protein